MLNSFYVVANIYMCIRFSCSLVLYLPRTQGNIQKTPSRVYGKFCECDSTLCPRDENGDYCGGKINKTTGTAVYSCLCSPINTL